MNDTSENTEKPAHSNESGGNKSGGVSNKVKVGGIALSLVVLAALALYMNLSSLTEKAAEHIGTRTLGVGVHISSVDVNLQNKTIDVHGLRIDNPSGFDSAYAMNFDNIRIAADQISREKLVFNEISVSGTTINLEVTEKATNLTEIRKNVEANAAETDSDAAPIKVVIKDLAITDGTLNPRVTLAGGDMKSVTIPDIRLTGIGERQNGVLASEAIAQVLDDVVKATTRVAMRQGFLDGMASDSLKDIQSNLNLPTSLLDQVGGDVKKLGEDIEGGLKGLMGN